MVFGPNSFPANWMLGLIQSSFQSFRCMLMLSGWLGKTMLMINAQLIEFTCPEMHSEHLLLDANLARSTMSSDSHSKAAIDLPLSWKPQTQVTWEIRITLFYLWISHITHWESIQPTNTVASPWNHSQHRLCSPNKRGHTHSETPICITAIRHIFMNYCAYQLTHFCLILKDTSGQLGMQ